MYFKREMIPPGVSMFDEYIVKKGDTLYKIANEFNVSIEEIMQANNMESTIIYPNQVLLIPKKGIPEMAYIDYVTKAGDTLASISAEYNIDPEWLVKYNDVLNLELASNQLIKIPVDSSNNQYTVEENDTLETVLERTGLTCAELCELNVNEFLKPGNVIYIK